MSIEFSVDVINQVQIALRNDAGLPSYDPSDPTLPSLPSLAASVAGLHPSPPYLRCSHCKGKLLSGIQSLICIYCGKYHKQQVPPPPISFNSTFGYQFLLQSLDLDGSETIGASTEGNKLSRGQSTSKQKISLSEFLDLQITWLDEPEQPETDVSSQKLEQHQSPEKLAGIDLDNFFSGPKEDIIFNASEEFPILSKQVENTENKALSGEDNISLFQNFPPSETAVGSSQDASDNSGWEAAFQSSNSGNQLEGFQSVDPFVVSTVDLSSHMDSVFGHGENLKDGKPKDDSAPSSIINDWPEDDLWNNASSAQSDSTVNVEERQPPDNLNNPSSENVDWFQDDTGQNNTTTVPRSNMINEVDDSFDEWDEFSSSTGAQDPSRKSGNETAVVDEKTPEAVIFNSMNNFQEVDFGSFSQEDLFAGSPIIQSSSTELNKIPSDRPTLDRFDDKDEVEGAMVTEPSMENINNFKTTSQQKDDAEKIMSQMHDLSFMLETNLSIPPKLDRPSSLSQD